MVEESKQFPPLSPPSLVCSQPSKRDVVVAQPQESGAVVLIVYPMEARVLALEAHPRPSPPRWGCDQHGKDGGFGLPGSGHITTLLHSSLQLE